MGKYIDLTGQRFGRLVCVKDVGRSKNRQALWLCMCDCGENTIVVSTNLTSGHTKSCKCLQADIVKKRSTTHGFSRDENGTPKRLYTAWLNMKSRCSNPANPAYKNYGGRGITICNKWSKYENFHKWAMSNGYKNNLTIERMNNNGNYEPDNCTWIPRTEQPKNTRATRFIDYFGKKKTIAEWGRILNMSRSLLYWRLKKYSIEKALTTPIRRRQNAVETINA